MPKTNLLFIYCQWRIFRENVEVFRPFEYYRSRRLKISFRKNWLRTKPTLYTTFYTMMIIFDIMSWSFLIAFLWFSDWSHTAVQKPSSEQGMAWLKVTYRFDSGGNWAVAHPTATGCKWLTFCFTTMIQRNESAHTAWCQIMVSDRVWYGRHRAAIARFFSYLIVYNGVTLMINI